MEESRTNRGWESWRPRMPALMEEAPLSRMTVGIVVECMALDVGGCPPADGEVSEMRNAGRGSMQLEDCVEASRSRAQTRATDSPTGAHTRVLSAEA